MPLASTWLDLVVGADIHIEMVPTPGGPVPTPFPHPFLGLVGDPAGAAVEQLQSALVSLATGGSPAPASGKTLINGLPATTTSTVAKNAPTLAHVPLPPGAAFQKPPDGDAKLPFGSLTVTLDGANAVRGGDPALSCGDPTRLPTSSVVVLPKGPPVAIGGPPGVNAASAAGEILNRAAVRTAWAASSALFRYAGRLNPTRLRNLLPRAKCFFTGHPVDVATGRVMTWTTDFTLPGPIPLVFSRDYASSWANRAGPLGPGWSHSLDRAVWSEQGKLVALVADGREVVFDTLDLAGGELGAGGEIADPVSGYTIKRTGVTRWRVTSPEGIVDELDQVPGDVPDDANRWGLARVQRTTNHARDAAIRYFYDHAARLVAVRDSGGRLLKFDHDAEGRLLGVLLPDPDEPDRWGRALELTYSDRGDLLAVRDALGAVTRYAYDAHLMVQETDRNGLSFYWIYDGRSSHARCVRTWGDRGIHDSVIDYGDRFSTVTDSEGRTTLYRTNELGAIVEILDPAGKKRRLEYDDTLNIAVEVDPLGRSTRTSRDARGRPAIVETPDGQHVALKHHRVFHELVSLYQNQCGSIWRWKYDRRGRLTSAVAPAGEVTAFEWRRGLLSAITDAGGQRTEHEYDAAGNQIRTVLPNGGEIRRVFDLRGRLRAVAGPTDGRATIDYDLLDRVTRVGEPDGNIRAFEYDAEGNLTGTSDQHRRIRCTYGDYNRLIARDDGGDAVHYAYDREGRLIEMTNERGQPYRFEYDARGRLSREIAFDLQERRYVRDATGRITEIKGSAGSTKLRYDDADRITEQEQSDGTKSTFTYRADGALLSAVNGSMAVTFERDEIGRVLTEIQGDHRVTSAYGPTGERVSIHSSLGAYQAVLRDPIGSPRSVFLGPPNDPARQEIAFTRDAAGLELRRRLPGGVAVALERDAAGRLIAQHADATGTSWSRQYAWRAGEQLAAIEDSRFGTSTFQHDGRGRLVSVTATGGAVQHRALDEVGNLYRTGDRGERRYVRGGVLRNDGETQLAFDRAGNLVSRQLHSPGGTAEPAPWRYEWNADGTLKEVSTPDGEHVAFAYDALGRRISKKTANGETRYVWDGDALLHEQGESGATVTWYQAPETFEPLARSEGNVWHHVVVDQVGAPLAIYDAGGAHSWDGQVDPYGALTPADDPAGLCPWRWPGQYHDAETGLAYNRARYYDAGLGQYISQDPIGLAGGLSPYAYVADPLVLIDPLGLAACKTGPEATIRLYHGSISDYTTIRQHGLDPQRVPVWVTTSRRAARNAINPERVVGPFEGNDRGIVRSVVPKAKFEALIESGGISPTRTWPAFNTGEDFPENVLRSAKAVELFNGGIKRS